MATSYKCPNCSANLIFDADQQKMTCSHCGTALSPKDVTQEYSKLDSEAMSREDARDEALKADVTGLPHEERDAREEAEASPDEAEPEFFSDDDSSQFVCGNCGAAVITDKNTTATFCAFCGSPTIIRERLVDARKPDYIIPFAIDRENAIRRFLKWCGSGRLTPIDFVNSKNIEKITGLYVPFWLFSADVDIDVKATAVMQVSSYEDGDSGAFEVIDSDYYSIQRKGRVTWKLVPYDSASHVEDEAMRKIAPYGYEKIVRFDMAYLSGFFADRYDVPWHKMEPDLKNRLATSIDRIISDSTIQYARLESVKDDSVIHPFRMKYAMIPVWFLTYRYTGKTYYFAMNGQTGKIAGEYPISILKVLLLLLAILPVAAVLVRFLIGGIMLGGLF